MYVTEKKATKVSLDPSQYESRYRTRQLEVHISGKNKMVKTVFSNLDDVAKDMQVSPEYLIKFIGYSLSAKVHKNTISGKYSLEVLSKIVRTFITTIICCSVCGKPEIELKELNKICRSCGSTTIIVSSDKFMKYVKSQTKKITKPIQTGFSTESQPYYIGHLESYDNKANDVWYSDVSEEAVKNRRMNQIGSNLLFE